MPSPKQINSSQPFVNSLNAPFVNGVLTFDLSQSANVTGVGGMVAPRRIPVTLDGTGKCPTTSIWFNDQLTPSGTTYLMQLFDASGNFAGSFGLITLSGSSPLDLSTLIVTTIGGGVVSFPSPLLTGAGLQVQAFTASGTFTIPSANVKVTVVGDGGGGGGSLTGLSGGGGGGGTAIKYLSGLTVGNTLTVTVGTGGAGGNATGTNGTVGSGSTVSSGTQTIATITGGGGGSGQAGNHSGAAGGNATGGDINYPGGGGGYGYGAGAGGSAPSGYGGATTVIGPTFQGSGGNGGNGQPNTGQGGQGASANSSSGGNGGSGIVVFEWIA